MTTLIPRGPYTQEELEKLYPKTLKLQLVQILLRHGERSPVSARFQNAGLTAFWPYCSAAQKLVSTTMNHESSNWSLMEWRRRLETFGSDDSPVIASGLNGELDAVCNLGELTDVGRKSTYTLGKRLRYLYVDQLQFMPSTIQDADMIYLRATPVLRTLESLQETFWGMYPPHTRSRSFPPPTITTRAPADETLYPNNDNCRRFAQLSRAFAQRTADRWNSSKEMDYLNMLISKWMPETSKRVAVDSHPRLSGIMDTINSTLAHGPATRLPDEFYDPKGREIIEKIGVEEWFSGFKESQEYRSLGIGALMGDILSRMVRTVEMNGNNDLLEVGGGGERAIKLGLSGCHDTTLAAILTSLGAFGSGEWPPYTSHIALELFRKVDIPPELTLAERTPKDMVLVSTRSNPEIGRSWFGRVFGGSTARITDTHGGVNAPLGMARKKVEELEESDRRKLDGYFVRVRYKDKPVSIPGCKAPGKHLEGDESFCTLVIKSLPLKER
jgi:acid phosphatase